MHVTAETPAPPARTEDRRHLRGAERRREILATAVDAFAESGFRGSTLRDIAQRIGISEAGLLHHFRSKADLLTATLVERDRRDEERRRLSEAEGAPFLDTVRDQVARNAATPELVGLHVVVSAEATDLSHPAHDIFRDRYRRLRHQDTENFRAEVAASRLRPDVDPERIGQLVSAVMDGLQLQWLLDPDDVDMVDLFEHFLQILGAPPRESAGDVAPPSPPPQET
ncbi:TetR family transcriptional regulator [Salana multivorans]|uniref:TetR family transcriptional regulator n=1 Tax=Salana multivorans TaxID=120377 RepID=A0A3N2D1X3_9MICO|nr:TetR/AcrR family transcriptional regulator [Salana multivorans]ROR93464.1 TetR family transcriptional regulator [Salana multivorans]